jgi:hypothetical protein
MARLRPQWHTHCADPRCWQRCSRPGCRSPQNHLLMWCSGRFGEGKWAHQEDCASVLPLAGLRPRPLGATTTAGGSLAQLGESPQPEQDEGIGLGGADPLTLLRQAIAALAPAPVRPARLCALHGEPLEDPRARYHDQACRQEAYRRRHGPAADNPASCPYCGHALTIRELLVSRASVTRSVTPSVTLEKPPGLVMPLGWSFPSSLEALHATPAAWRRRLLRILAAAAFPAVLLSLTLAAAHASDRRLAAHSAPLLVVVVPLATDRAVPLLETTARITKPAHTAPPSRRS